MITQKEQLDQTENSFNTIAALITALTKAHDAAAQHGEKFDDTDHFRYARGLEAAWTRFEADYFDLLTAFEAKKN